MKKVLISVGAAVTAVSIFATGVIAGPALENITVQLNHKLHFKLKGEAWTPKDSNGNIVAPITYNGTTYLPIRSAGEALGVKVGWDAATSTVLLGEADTAPPSAAGQYKIDDVVFSQVTAKKNAIDMWEITADLKNAGDDKIKGLLFTATFYDADGKRLGTANGAVQDLAADTSKTVTLISSDDLEGYASIKFQIDSQY